MLKRKNKTTTSDDVGHIKKHTLGSSNEISFSVLDAKVSSKSDATSSKPLSISGSPDTVTQPRWTFSANEVSARKQKRKRNKRAVAAICVLVCLIVLSIACFFGVRAIQHQMDYIGQLNDQVDIVSKESARLDSYQQMVNSAIDLPLSSINAQEQSALNEASSTTLDEVGSNLIEAKTNIERLQEHLITPSDTELSNKAISAVNAELNLIEIGRKIMDWAINYPPMYSDAQLFMDRLMEADTLAREAAESANESNRDSMNASIEKSNQCIAKFTEANALIVNLRDNAQNDTDRKIFQQFVNYIDLRKQAQESAIAADNAYLNVNSALLISESEKYDAAEAEAAQLISTLADKYPTMVLSATYDQLRKSDSDVESWRSELARAKDYISQL